MTAEKSRRTITLPTAEGTTRTFLLGSMSRAQANAFEAIPGPGEWYACHADAVIREGRPGPFTMLLGDAEGRLTAVTVEADGRRSR